MSGGQVGCLSQSSQRTCTAHTWMLMFCQEDNTHTVLLVQSCHGPPCLLTHGGRQNTLCKALPCLGGSDPCKVQLRNRVFIHFHRRLYGEWLHLVGMIQSVGNSDTKTTNISVALFVDTRKTKPPFLRLCLVLPTIRNTQWIT